MGATKAATNDVVVQLEPVQNKESKDAIPPPSPEMPSPQQQQQQPSPPQLQQPPSPQPQQQPKRQHEQQPLINNNKQPTIPTVTRRVLRGPLAPVNNLMNTIEDTALKVYNQHKVVVRGLLCVVFVTTYLAYLVSGNSFVDVTKSLFRKALSGKITKKMFCKFQR